MIETLLRRLSEQIATITEVAAKYRNYSTSYFASLKTHHYRLKYSNSSLDNRKEKTVFTIKNTAIF